MTKCRKSVILKKIQVVIVTIKYVQIVNMHEKRSLLEYSDKYLQKQVPETA